MNFNANFTDKVNIEDTASKLDVLLSFYRLSFNILKNDSGMLDKKLAKKDYDVVLNAVVAKTISIVGKIPIDDTVGDALNRISIAVKDSTMTNFWQEQLIKKLGKVQHFLKLAKKSNVTVLPSFLQLLIVGGKHDKINALFSNSSIDDEVKKKMLFNVAAQGQLSNVFLDKESRRKYISLGDNTTDNYCTEEVMPITVGEKHFDVKPSESDKPYSKRLPIITKKGKK